MFDAETLGTLATRTEVAVETTRPNGSKRRTVIWIVVDAGDVFVRSVRGERGHWFQAALDDPNGVALIVDGVQIPVRAELARDLASIERCSAALRAKYRPGGSLDSMVQPEVLETTLRLEPR